MGASPSPKVIFYGKFGNYLSVYRQALAGGATRMSKRNKKGPSVALCAERDVTGLPSAQSIAGSPIASLSECLLRSIVDRIVQAVTARAPANDVRPFVPLTVTGNLFKMLQVYGHFHAHLPAKLLLRGHRGELNALTQLRDGRIASCADDHRVMLWSDDGCSLLNPSRKPLYPNALTVLADGETLLVGSEIPALIDLYCTRQGIKFASLQGHEGWIWALAALGGGSDMVASASDDHTVRLWDCR